jgi:hypothetical protein
MATHPLANRIFYNDRRYRALWTCGSKHTIFIVQDYVMMLIYILLCQEKK